MCKIDWNLYKGSQNEKSKKGYIEFVNMLEESGFILKSEYTRTRDKVDIEIDGIDFNMTPNGFKCQTYKNIREFLNLVQLQNDEFIKFTGRTKTNHLIAKIKTYDGAIIEKVISDYTKFIKARKSTYELINQNGYNAKSPYLGVDKYMIIDFKCGHRELEIRPNNLKNGQRCAICAGRKN